ncbi:hypothetical protein IEQ34_020021 [Dendrobium chrysotoxum]|uniref:Uncharacterized protein n=1 Tax=Dendrobium chrysotoxum TaxID=161865 RepID=A0AAV7GAB7_DENCH|nr:hypothetical protein IEQ34_020021 [Dendrobium chrysotoxum]
MEEPSCSFLNKTLCSKEQSASSGEESGWTSYFEDFLASEKRKATETASTSSCSSSLHEGSSMVSDAASCTAWKPHQITGEPTQSFGKLSLKRKKERRVLEDDSLEDTASSPVNSPKVVGEFSLLDMKARKKRENKNKMAGYGDYKELASEGIKEPNYVGIVDECSELRKQGLCLVHLSMFSNYLG